MATQEPDDEAQATAQPVETTPATEEDDSGVDVKMALTAGFMGLLIGGFAGWATLNMGIGAIAFIAGAAGGGYFLYRKDMPSEAAGSGLYITALIMIMTPILFSLPNILTEGDGSAEAAGTFIGSILGLVIWGFVFLMLAVVTAAIGYYFKRRASKIRDNRTTSA